MDEPMHFPDDGWNEYLHYGRILTDEEHELLHQEFLRRIRDNDFEGMANTKEERLYNLERLKEKARHG